MRNRTSFTAIATARRVFVPAALFLTGLLVFAAFQTDTAEADHRPLPESSLVAPLSGDPINNVRPRGAAFFAEFENDTRVLNIGVERVALPPGTTLSVHIDGAEAGRFQLRFGAGALRLNSNEHTFPVPEEDSLVEIRHGDATVLSGTFRVPPEPATLRLFAPLEGAPVDGVVPRGVAVYTEFNGGDAAHDVTVRGFGVFVHRVNLPENTVLNVSVDGQTVGQIELDDDGDGGLRLNTAEGDEVPLISVGSTVEVGPGDTALLAGTFREFDRPFPPHPRRTRVFGGKMNGRQMVPPVETGGRGLIGVVLSPDRTHIRVRFGFRNLSSEQTTATINGPAHRGETGPVIFDLGTVGGTSGRSEVLTFPVTPEQIAQLRSGHWYAQIGTAENPDGEIRGQIRSRHHRSRFDDDERADIALFRPADGTWYVSAGTGFTAHRFGRNGDIPVAGDFDGDGVTDHSVYRAGTWLIRRSSDEGLTTKQFGLAGDKPVQGDYDGDGLADTAVFRPYNGTWYIRKSGDAGYVITRFGLDGDIPVASDFDGDGKTDIALFRGSDGTWHWLRSSDGAYRAARFGLEGDRPVAGDFDGDGRDDLAVYRDSTGVWYVHRSSDGAYDIRQFGLSGDTPVADDYDGDGVTDLAVFRGPNRTWYIWNSSDNTYDFRYFGLAGDIPANRH